MRRRLIAIIHDGRAHVPSPAHTSFPHPPRISVCMEEGIGRSCRWVADNKRMITSVPVCRSAVFLPRMLTLSASVSRSCRAAGRHGAEVRHVSTHDHPFRCTWSIGVVYFRASGTTVLHCGADSNKRPALVEYGSFAQPARFFVAFFWTGVCQGRQDENRNADRI